MLALAIVLICVAILLGGFAWKFKLERGDAHFHRANALAGLLAIVLAAASLWAFIAVFSGNDNKPAAQQRAAEMTTTATSLAPAPTATSPAPTVTTTVTATPTASPTPTVTTTKTVPRTSTVPPSTTVSTVVVSAPKANAPKAKTSTTSKPTPTHSKPKPKPSPTKATPKPKPAKPVIVNVTTLSSVNVHDEPGAPNSSDNFCAVGNMPGHDQGVMTFTSVYGSFTENVFTGSEIGGGCAKYIAPSIVPPGGTDTVTVTLRDMNTGQSVTNVQTFTVQNSVHP